MAESPFVAIALFVLVYALVAMWNQSHSPLLATTDSQEPWKPSRSNKPATTDTLKQSICSDRRLIHYLQQQQLRMSACELELDRADGGNNNPGFLKLNQCGLLFSEKPLPVLSMYDDNFYYMSNLTAVRPILNTSIHYYAICKAGSTYIRQVLATAASNIIALFESLPDHTKQPLNSTHTEIHPFTFVRDPIARFISGYNEVEYRLAVRINARNASRYLPLTGFYGTERRVKEFIRMLVASNGSQTSADFGTNRYRDAELGHISPMIGVIYNASITEKQPLRLYRIESFSSEWTRLASETGYNDLLAAEVATPSYLHDSTIWPFTLPKKAAERLLYRNFEHGSLSDQIHYLRAVCRLYLVDFICAGYPLPIACEDISEEIPDIVHSFLNRSSSNTGTEQHRDGWSTPLDEL